jgi:hypothetical protein
MVVMYIPHLFSKVFSVQIFNADISSWYPLVFFSFQRVSLTAKHYKVSLGNST